MVHQHVPRGEIAMDDLQKSNKNTRLDRSFFHETVTAGGRPVMQSRYTPHHTRTTHTDIEWQDERNRTLDLVTSLRKKKRKKERTSKCLRRVFVDDFESSTNRFYNARVVKFHVARLRNTAAADTLLLLIYCTTDLSRFCRSVSHHGSHGLDLFYTRSWSPATVDLANRKLQWKLLGA